MASFITSCSLKETIRELDFKEGKVTNIPYSAQGNAEEM